VIEVKKSGRNGLITVLVSKACGALTKNASLKGEAERNKVTTAGKPFCNRKFATSAVRSRLNMKLMNPALDYKFNLSDQADELLTVSI
jgi:hypothetical protein